MWAILAGLVLLLATPLVVSPDTMFPFVVGKALYSRSVIAALLALWALLALLSPAYRPPRSRIVLLLAAGLGVSLLAAAWGASFEHSLWSDYRRMQGVVDEAHWLALAVVLVSTLRDAAASRMLLRMQVGFGAVAAAVAVARYAELPMPFLDLLPERSDTRTGSTLGNPIYLGGYMLVNALLAAGLAARAQVRPRSPGRRPPRAAVAGWSGAGLLHLAGLAVAGSVGAWLGLVAGAGFVLLAAACLLRGRRRWMAGAALGMLGAAVVGAGVHVTTPGTSQTLEVESPLLRYVTGVHIERPSVQARLGAWEAGLQGWRARPLLGWGPENFEVPFARYGSGYAAAVGIHDRAHNVVVETAATTGAAGLALWVALWAMTFAVIGRAWGRLEAGERALALFVAAALFARLAWMQFAFDSPATLL